MKPGALAERALAVIRKNRKVRDPVLVHTEQATDPATGETVHEFVAVSSADANGPQYRVVFDAKGTAPVTIQPETNVLTLNPGETLDETITVTIPANAAPSKADVYFLADTTGSMSGVLAAVQAGATNILAAF